MFNKTYKAEFEDDKSEIIFADDDKEAFYEALGYDDDHGNYFDLFEIDDNDNKIRKVLEDDM